MHEVDISEVEKVERDMNKAARIWLGCHTVSVLYCRKRNFGVNSDQLMYQ